jgi:hypothetical protein
MVRSDEVDAVRQIKSIFSTLVAADSVDARVVHQNSQVIVLGFEFRHKPASLQGVQTFPTIPSYA